MRKRGKKSAEFEFKLLRVLMTFAEHVVATIEAAQSPDSRLGLEQRVRSICGVCEGLKGYLGVLHDVGLERLELSELKAELEAMRQAAAAEAGEPYSDNHADDSNHGS
jgi:hypothetical protein